MSLKSSEVIKTVSSYGCFSRDRGRQRLRNGYAHRQIDALDHTGAECHGATQANTTPMQTYATHSLPLAACRFPSVTTNVHKVYCCSPRLIVNETATIRVSAWRGFIQAPVQSGRGCCRPQNAAKKRKGGTRARMHGGAEEGFLGS